MREKFILGGLPTIPLKTCRPLHTRFATSTVPREMQREQEYRILLAARDEFGNLASVGEEGTEARLVCVIRGRRTLSESTTAIVPLNVKKYTKNEFALSVFLERSSPTGNYEIDCSAVKRRGINSVYYNSLWLGGTPASRRVEQKLDFDWGFAAVAGGAEDFVSAHFDGYLGVEVAGYYHFYLGGAQNSVKVWIDGELKFVTEGEEHKSINATTYSKIAEKKTGAEIFSESIFYSKTQTPVYLGVSRLYSML